MADGIIKIDIEVDGKQVEVASKELDKLEDSGMKSGKGIKAAEDSMASLSDSSSRAGKDVKGASDSLDNLGDSGSKAGKDLKGADGAIDGLADSSAGASSSVKGVSDSLDGMSGKAGEAANSAKKVKDETEGMGQGTQKASIGLKDLAVSLGLVALASAAFNTLKSSLDSAIARFDTLATFPKVLQALGVSAEDSERAMSNLSEGIDGLPTTLDDISGSAQRMYNSFKDIDETTDTAIALNNALLASGSNAEVAKRGTDQYIKSLQTGKINMDTWNTLSETMGIGLTKIAENFGFVGDSIENDLYNALQDGSISLRDFNNKLIELGTGTGELATLAKTNSLGIATSLGNLRNAAARGIAAIIDSFNNLSVAVTGRDIAQNIDGLKAVVNASFKTIGSVIEGTVPFIIFFASAIKSTVPVVETLTPAIIGLVAAYATYAVVTKAGAAISAANMAIAAAQATTKALTIATKAQIAAQITMTTVDRAGAVATVAQTSAVTLSTYAIGVMTGTIKLSAVAKGIAAAATYAWGAALNFLAGPIGWLIAGIGLLVTSILALNKWVKKATEEANRLNAETEGLSDSTNALSESINGTSEAYKSNQDEINKTAHSSSGLAKKIEELSAKENKSAADKLLLKDSIEQLNGSVDGLNLAYSEEANALSMSSEELQGRIKLMQDQEALQAGQERQTEIMEEQFEIGMKLSEVNDLRLEWNQKLEEGSIKAGEHKTALGELNEQEAVLLETAGQLGEQYKTTGEQITTSTEAITEAIQSGVSNQIIAFEDLSEYQQATVESMQSSWEEYKNSATDMFDTISTKSEVSVSKMTKNLESNQKTIADWSENIAKLAERGVDEGLLNTLREAGPESAGHVNALVKASDSELEKLSTAFAKGGDVATDALSKSLGIGKSGVMEAVGHLVTDTEKALADSIKSADFESLGVDIAKGQAGGIEKGTPEAEKAAQKMAKATEDAARKESETHSPSRVFERIGIDLTDGLALGVNNGTSKVLTAIQKLFSAIQNDSKRSFSNITSDYDNAIKEIERTLDKLPKVTGKSMDSTLKELKSGAELQISTMKTLNKDYDTSVKDIEKSFDKLVELTQNSMKNMLDRLDTGADSQVKVMVALAKKLLTPFNNTPSQFETIGKNSMAGFNRGLVAGEATVMATARRIASSAAATMRKELDIHSPSRIFMAIGRFIVDGLTSGINSSKRKSDKAMQDVSRSLIEVAENHASTITKIDKDARIERWKIHTDGVAKEKDLETKAAEAIQKIRKTASDKKRYLTADETKKIQSIRADAATKIQKLEKDSHDKVEAINKKARAEKVKAEEGLAKQRLDAIKNYIADKKSLEEMNLVTEAHIWEQSLAQFEEGTKERIEAQKAYKNAVEAVNKEIETINKEHEGRMQKINDDLKKQVDDLNKTYDDALSSRTQSLQSFAGTFDEFNWVVEQSSKDLMRNLQSQVEGFELWQKQMEMFAGRAVDKGLIEELRKMGPKALPQLLALNSMTERELTEYSALYQQKSKLAREQAEEELIGMKEDTEQRIDDLRKAANHELDIVRAEWVVKIRKIVQASDNELKKLEDTGRQAGEGLLRGLTSMEPALIAKARSIAQAIRDEIDRVLEIASPSKATYRSGAWLGDGLIGGMDSKMASIKNMATEMARIAIPQIPDIGFPSNVGQFGSTSTTTTDKSKKMTNYVTIQTTDSNVGKEVDRLHRRWAFKF